MNSRMIRTIKREDMNGASWKTSDGIFYTSIIAIVLVSSFLIQISSVAPSEALTRYYNCIARVANKNATLSMANVDACYNLIFKGVWTIMVSNSSQHWIIKILVLRIIQRSCQTALKGKRTILILNLNLKKFKGLQS